VLVSAHPSVCPLVLHRWSTAMQNDEVSQTEMNPYSAGTDASSRFSFFMGGKTMLLCATVVNPEVGASTADVHSMDT